MKSKTTNRLSVLICTMLVMSSMISAQVTGDGNVVIQERDVSNFTGIVVKSGIDVMIKQGGQQSLEIKADENLQKYIISEVEGGVLTVYVKENTRIMRSHAMDALITVNEISKIKVSGGGDLSAGEFKAKNASLKLTGGSDATIHVDENLEVEASGGSQVWVSGDPEIDAKLSGGSKVNKK